MELLDLLSNDFLSAVQGLVCDKTQVAGVLEAMVSARLRHCLDHGYLKEFRVFASLRDWIMGMGQAAPRQDAEPELTLTRTLRWPAHQRTSHGETLLAHAAVRGDTAAVCRIARERPAELRMR